MGFSIGGALKTAGGIVGTSYDYLTPGAGSNRLTNWSGINNGTTVAPYSAPAATTTKTTSTPTYDWNAMQSQSNALSQQIAQLQSQLAQQPKLPFYNTSAAWANAQKSAQSVVDPVYTDKLNQYLAKAALDRKQQEENTQANIDSINSELQQTLQDTATSRTRAGEDQTTQTGDVNQQETNYQTTEGTAFDRARAALMGNVANSGLTTSGIGQRQVGNAVTDRNEASKEQTQQFDNARRDINTTANRTFEDLTTSETRANEGATVKTKATQKALQDFIDTAALDENSFRAGNEADRLGAIASETNNQYKLGVNNFVAALIGSGARAQDIQLAQQVYG